MAIWGVMWRNMALCGVMRGFVAFFSFIWRYVVLCGVERRHLTLCGAMRRYVALCGLCGVMWCFLVLNSAM